MDIDIAHGHGLLYVRLQPAAPLLSLTAAAAFVGALVVGLYAVLPNHHRGTTERYQMATLPQDRRERILR
jgi:hypothetical protein